MPSSDSTDPKKPVSKPPNPPVEQEHLPCPRCDSTNTKFCYYNNYNFSQPRHFCKSCRRYWTHGGTLRDIPIGGGTRKSAKRSRTSATVLSPVCSASSDHHSSIPLSSTPVLMPLTAAHGGVFGGEDVKGSVSVGVSGSFTSLLNTQGPGFLALGGFGLNVGHGFEEVGFGLGRSVWPFPGVVGDGGVSVGVGSNGGGGGGIGNAWQFESAESGFGGGDCFPWPDLAISTPGSGLK